MENQCYRTYSLQISLDSNQKNKALYGKQDQRKNLDELESSELEKSFVEIVKKQAESVICLISNQFLIKKTEGSWQLSSHTPTLAQVVENEISMKYGATEVFGEQEAFRNEYAAGFGTAFLVGKQLAMTAAHCICTENSNILDEKIIATTYLVFGFQNTKKNPSDYLFADKQVYQIKRVVSHQFTRIQDKNLNFNEWTDWALLELDREASYTPIKTNMTEKVADKIELYMLGHPYGLPLKFTSNGFVQRNKHNDFFETNLDAFGGNSGSPIFNKAIKQVEGILCSGGQDYEITENYRVTSKRRIQAHQITKQESGRNGFEICQRLHVLRFLVGKELLNLEGIDQQKNTQELIIQSIKAHYKACNTIPHLLHTALPIHEIYTELVLLRKDKEEVKDKKKAFEEHRINSWEDIHTAKEPVELFTLFETKEGKAAKRLLILGRAGVGKSTLCQYIANQWAEETLWKGKFDALFWLPLRKLQNAHSAETASSFIFRVCCQEKSQTLYSKNVADYLKENSERILLVLDGLDEVTLEENSLQKSIVDELLKFPHWIMTSRPHAAGSISADMSIENVGFASKTIDLYIEKSFPTNGETISKKIRQNPIIFGLCHIPINLELVCSILKKSKGSISSIYSMTGLYEELTLTLQRRFLEKIGRPHAWKWQSGDLEQDHQTRKIFGLLESIAWTGMQNKQLFFSFNRGKMKEIYYCYSSIEERDQLFIQTCATGFLYSSGDNEDFLRNEYSFLHLTFQEFFAARYLVRLLQNNPSEAAKLIREVKFDPRYKVVIWFLAGLLKNVEGHFENLTAFFDILDTPKDSVGFYSALLKVRCLEECGWPNELRKMKSYKKEIQFWCERMSVEPLLNSVTQHLVETFEISPQGAKHFFIPVLNSCFSGKGLLAKRESCQSLSRVWQADPQLALSLLTSALKDEDYEVRMNAIETLSQIAQVNLPLALPLLAQAINDEGDSDFRQKAAQVLGKVKQIDQQLTLPVLVHAFQKGIGVIRDQAVYGLGEMSLVDPQHALPFLAQAIKDEVWCVRATAVAFLSRISLIYPHLTFPLLIESLQDDMWMTQEEALKAIFGMDQVPFKSTLSLLAQALKDKGSNADGDAIISLSQISQADSQETLSIVAQALKHENWYVRIIAGYALYQVGQADLPLTLSLLVQALKDKDKYVGVMVVHALCKIGQAEPQLTLSLLAQAFKDEDSNVRKRTVKALGQIGQADLPLTLSLLAQALRDEDVDARVRAVIALGQISQVDPQSTLSLLAQALKDKDSSIKTVAVRTLGQIGLVYPQLVLSILGQALQDPMAMDEAVRTLNEIGHVHPQLVLPFLAQAFKSDVWHIRYNAVSNLGQIGQADPQLTLSLLAQALKDEDPGVRSYAVIALSQLGQTDPQRTFSLMSQTLKNEDLSVRKMAASYLFDISPFDPQLTLSLLVQAFPEGAELNSVVFALQKYNVSSILKHNSELFYHFYSKVTKASLLKATTLNALIKCFKENPFNETYLSAIVLKCIEENQSIFQEDDSLCFYEHGKIKKVKLVQANLAIQQIEKLVYQYPEFILHLPSSNQNHIEKKTSKQEDRFFKLNQKGNASETSSCLIQ
ncbi:MAG: HEAT repeat domain-containing protein [Parachlamydiaceae bacterium]|nr:HEAT repeat domain-containing protein [Parachlamydiaceae bacterium]